MNFFAIRRLILSSLFKKESTVAYPIKPMPKHELVRGHIACEIESCIFCGMCQRKCPTGAITVTKDEKAWQISRFQCIVCNCCVEVCPKKCLSMKNELTPASDHLEIVRVVSEKHKDAVNDARIPADA